MDARLVELSSKLDDLIEFEGFMNPELIRGVFGRGMSNVGANLAGQIQRGAQTAIGGVQKGAEAAAGGVKKAYGAVAGQLGKAAETSTVAGPKVLGGGMATGGSGPGPLEKPVKEWLAARAGAQSAIPSPIGAPSGTMSGPTSPTYAGGAGLLAAAKQKALAAGGAVKQQAVATGGGVKSFLQRNLTGAENIGAADPNAAKAVANQAGMSRWKVGAIGTGVGAAAGLGAAAYMNRPKDQQQMSALLDDIIQFWIPPEIPPGSRYPLPVLQASWRKWKKPSQKTLGNMMRSSERLTGKNPTMVFRPKPTWLSAKLDERIEFGILDTILQGAKAAGSGLLGYVRQYPVASTIGAGLLGAAVAKKKQEQNVVVNEPKSSQMSALLDDLIQFARGDIYKRETGNVYIPPRHSKMGFIGKSMRYRTVDPKSAAENLREAKWLNKVRKLKFSVIDQLINFADPRPRNPLGEFTSQQGGPDPNAMATTYKMPQAQPQQQGLTMGKAAGAAIAGGALGSIGSNIGKAGWESSIKLIKDLAAKRKKV